MQAGGKRAVVCAHRRWGKDEVALHHTACAAHERVGNYAHMLPKYEQARKAIWNAITAGHTQRRIDEAFPLEIRDKTLDDEMFIRFKNGSTWQVVGSDNYNSLMGTSYAGMVLSEDAQANPAAWAYFSPILRENNGWALFISTPRGRNHFYQSLMTARTLPSWFAQVSPVSETHALTQAELDEELLTYMGRYGEEYGRSVFLQEYECSFDAAIPGSIWGDCLDALVKQERIVDFSHNPDLPVDTGWDLGRTDDTSIWFRQIDGRRIDIIDHHASHLKDIDFYIRLLLQKRLTHGITYGTHWLPHDARPRTLAAGGKSILQQFHDAAKEHPELGRFAICPRLDRQEGIQAARKTFPFCRFHKTRCATGLESLRHYHREYDEDKKLYIDNPEHDWASHDADAWRYLSLTWTFRAPEKPDSPLVDKLLDFRTKQLTLGYIREQHFEKRHNQRVEQEG